MIITFKKKSLEMSKLTPVIFFNIHLHQIWVSRPHEPEYCWNVRVSLFFGWYSLRKLQHQNQIFVRPHQILSDFQMLEVRTQISPQWKFNILQYLWRDCVLTQNAFFLLIATPSKYLTILTEGMKKARVQC